ncbi:MAG TPA: glycerophosphodiester phosphodiesterase family protein [Candidatus Solibacter sp.]|nr:glycerophosphodiester phosphodiesterase family protein [Candidatus Solibacter sp.]
MKIQQFSDTLVAMRNTLQLSTAALVLAGACVSIGSQDAGQPRTILTSAHRGEHHHHPENSLPAIQGAIEAGMDFVELDIRTTSDGHLILMHDSTVDRMTNGHGPVSAMTLADIRKLDLGARFPGQFPDLRVPTFDEALALAKGRIGIYVDTKSASPKDLVAAIDRHEMGAHVMFYSVHPEFLKQISDLRPQWTLLPEAFNPENVSRLLELLHPKVLGFDARDYNGPTIAAAKQGKVGIFVDLNTPQEWQNAIEVGVAGIQTDHPVELMAFLRAKGYHK